MHSGKKGGKKSAKNAEKEADIKAMSVVNSNLWQARLEVVEQSRSEHMCYGFISIFFFIFVFNFSALSYVFVYVIIDFRCITLLVIIVNFLCSVLCFDALNKGADDCYVIRLGCSNRSLCLETMCVMLGKACYML